MIADEEDELRADREAAHLNRKLEQGGFETSFLEGPFLEAAELGDAASLKQRLVTLSPDDRWRLIRSVDQQGRTGLLLAAIRGKTELARVLLDAGASPSDADSYGATALHYASARGAIDLVSLLLYCCAQVGRRDDDGETPLTWSKASCMSALLEARAEPGARSVGGRTALMGACRRGDLAAIDLLARLPGVELDAVDAGGVSACAGAVTAGHAEAAELLVQLGAARPATSSAPRRVARPDEALHDAARRGDASSCTAILAETGISPDVELTGERPLLLAADRGAGRAMEVLLQARADPNCSDRYLQETPLLRVVLSGCNQELLCLLLEARADASQADLVGRMPAEVAASWGHAAGAQILRAAVEGRLDLDGLD